MRPYIFSLTALMLLSAGRLPAQTLAPYAGEFLSIGAGARSLAMGGAYTALAVDASGGYWNPSALIFLDRADALLMHEERFAGLVNYDLGAVAMPYGANTALGITLLRMGIDGIPDSRKALVDQNGNGELDPGERLDYARITYVNAADWALFISYAQKSTEDFSFGISIKILRRSVAEFDATGIGFDAGVQYTPAPSIKLGAVLQDATTTLLAWSTGRTELIAPSVRLGAAYELKVGNFHFIPAAEGFIRFEERGKNAAASVGAASIDPAVGFEIDYDDVLALRAGMSEVGYVTMGAGLHIKRLFIDYAFTGFGKTSDLGTSHRISLRLALERPF